MRWLRFLAAWLLVSAQAYAVPLDFDLGLQVPPVVADSQAPVACTIAFMIADTANNDLFASRMSIEAAETDSPKDNRLPCPANLPPRVGLRALDVCTTRATNAKYCVFADMSRGFDTDPDIHNTSEIASRCASDKSSDLGVACVRVGKLSVCNTACGNSPEAAVANARARCEEKQQKPCLLTATVPVSPQ